MAKKDWNEWWIKSKKYSKLLILSSKPAYRNYKKLLENVKLPRNPKILELGCGSGALTLWLVNKYEGKATLVDYSKEALGLSKALYNKNKTKAEFINEDIAKLKLKKKHDLVHSQGLIEHFKGKKQNIIVRKHEEFLKKRGIALITAPRPSFFYKAGRRITELLTKWPFGYEEPINTKDGIRLLERNGLRIMHCKEFAVETGYVCKKK